MKTRTKVLVGCLVLAASVAAASAITGGGSGSSSGGGGGGSGIPATSTLGACDGSSAGSVVYLTTANAIRMCDGTAWRSVFSSADGVLPAPNLAVPGNWFTASAASGAAFRVLTAGSRIEVGPGPNAYLQELSGVVYSPYLNSQQVQADTFASLTFSAPTLLLNPLGWNINTSSTPFRSHIQRAVTFDSASINNGSCLSQTVTVAGAVLGDAVTVNADFALPDTVGIGNARVTGPDTVALRLCNIDLALPSDPPSGIYNFTLER